MHTGSGYGMPSIWDEWVSCGGLQVDGNKVTWEKWHIRTSFNYREGLVLHDVGCATLIHHP